MEPQQLRRLLRARVQALRCESLQFKSLDEPQSVATDTILTAKGYRQRRRVVLTAHGCLPASCAMCPLPNESVPRDIPVTLANWMNQLRLAVNPQDDLHTLTLFHNGNFFSDHEIPDSWRSEIYKFLRGTRIRELVVESLPQYLTPERLNAARVHLGDIRLTVAIGLQSASELVREVCIGSPCRRDSLENAVQLLHRQGAGVQVFLLYHPPFLTLEEAMHDLQESIRYVHALSLLPTVCPMRVAPHTVVGDLAASGHYVAANLWHLYDALNGISHVRIAASLLRRDEDSTLLDAFAALNRTGSLPVLNRPTSPPLLNPHPADPREVYSRIEGYLRRMPSREPNSG